MELSPDEQRKMYDSVLRTENTVQQITLEGCHAGREMNDKVKTEFRNEFKNNTKYLKIIGSVSAGIGALIAFLWGK